MDSKPSHAPTVVIDNFYPMAGEHGHLLKRIIGEPLDVFVDLFKDGHDIISAVLKWRFVNGTRWVESPMRPMENDRWRGQCVFTVCGRWEYAVEAWPDSFRSWKKHFKSKFDVNDADVPVEAREGAMLLNEAGQRAKAFGAMDSAAELDNLADMLQRLPAQQLIGVVMSMELQEILDRFPDRSLSTTSQKFCVIVERERARFSAWYEFFPRSAEGILEKHSTFRDCLPRLDDAKSMGFDIIYFPPIHPIGVSHRKGKNNTVSAQPGDVGSPWAIGSTLGGHRAVEPALGTVEDFEWLVGEARKRDLDIALDFAVNCSPDHPYVKEHPDWFYQRADGTIRYAENPPKKYQDIYSLNFHCEDWKGLWRELIDVVLFWVERGVKVFRVDNPHTKPVAFWEVLIAEVHARDAEVIFLAEAFTRPRMMEALGKIGFTQSYTYFTWRENKQEITEYLRELTQTDMRWYYRANFWPNTPDILAHHLQNAGPAMFKIRAALAALLSSNWGIYSGYELCENKPLPGKEEYLDSEKYQVTARDWNAPGNIKGFIRQLNNMRHENAALQLYDNVRFHGANHGDVIVFSKATADFSNRILVCLNLNPNARAETMIHLDMAALGLNETAHYKVNDLLHGLSFDWKGADNFVSLDPNGAFTHAFCIEG